MPLVLCFRQGGLLLLLLLLLLPFLSCAAQTADRRALLDSTCEARTVNYITHTLPQICLTSTTWTNPAPSSTEPLTSSRAQVTGNESTRHGAQERVTPTATVQSGGALSESEAVAGDAVATPFMSFEDWKEMMLRRAGQDPQELRQRKPNEHRATDRSPPESGDSGLGEEGEISLSFGTYPGGDEGGAGTHVDAVSRESDSSDGAEEALTMHRSKDAGKTCKERFSYSSFDAGATILKTGPGAKNAKAILVENKDSYMLLECAAQNKYAIVELSDDILIDTVVIANFEFFSSMIRHFRVSVSDRYPVKSDKWRDLGIFEARNSRDIQPFLVENPQIWAKYVRIEFLTHYGNEYYCPVSLLRVHGSRMLDSWKDIETSRDDEGLGEEEEDAQDSLEHGQAQLTVAATEPELPEVRGNLSEPSKLADTSPWLDPFGRDPFYQLTATCAASPGPLEKARLMNGPESGLPEEGDARQHGGPLRYEERGSNAAFAAHGSPRGDAAAQIREASMMQPSKQHPDSVAPSPDSRQAASAELIDNAAGAGSGGPIANASMSASKSTNSAAAAGKSRNSWTTTSATAASPTVQEGFFNAITKRLQQVESNLTLSLKYVEDQSRHMQDVLQRAEQKQLSKLSLFLGDLNQTVLAELRNVRDQYDQIWQYTVLALESQRDQSERDIVALSTRLNLLADEVVFQKRMAIMQAVLLLSCLFLVIFSRGVPIPHLAPLQEPVGAVSYAAATSPRRQQQDEGGLSTTSSTVDYAHAPLSAASSQSPRMTLGLPGSHGADCQATPPEYQRLSPPLTPGLQDDTMYADMHVSGRDPQATSLRRPSSLHHNNSRKPLPSLPEHSVPNDAA